MSSLPISNSKSFQALNPHIYGGQQSAPVPAANGQRVRQNRKMQLNKLEAAWLAQLNVLNPAFPRPRGQAKKFRLANGAWYCPDISASSWPQPDGQVMETAWECKGGKEMKNVARGILTIKFAAAAWPEVAFYLVWKENGQFKQQRILP